MKTYPSGGAIENWLHDIQLIKYISKIPIFALSKFSILSNPDTTIIRAFQKQDTDSVIQIWLDASALAHDFISYTYWTTKTGDMRDIYIPQSETFVHEDDNTRKIVGFISHVDDYIAAIFITPGHQGKGFGQQLMNHVKQIKKRLTLQIYTENIRSVSFYKKQGLRIIRQQTDKDTGHEEFVMENIR